MVGYIIQGTSGEKDHDGGSRDKPFVLVPHEGTLLMNVLRANSMMYLTMVAPLQYRIDDTT